MANNLTNYAENAILNKIMGNSGTIPTAYHVALLTAVSDQEGGSVTEVTTTNTGYARQSISFTNSTAGQLANDANVVFSNTTGTASFGTVTHIGISDSSTVGSGNFWWIGSMTSKQVDIGDTLTFAANVGIQLSLD